MRHVCTRNQARVMAAEPIATTSTLETCSSSVICCGASESFMLRWEPGFAGHAQFGLEQLDQELGPRRPPEIKILLTVLSRWCSKKSMEARNSRPRGRPAVADGSRLPAACRP